METYLVCLLEDVDSLQCASTLVKRFGEPPHRAVVHRTLASLKFSF